MRLGVLGPANGDYVALAAAARALVDEHDVDRVLYVGADQALDLVVSQWAHGLAREALRPELDGPSPFLRAALACASASPDAIERYVEAEEAREQLRLFGSVPHPGRTVELLDGRFTVFVYDKATLDEEDIVSAQIFVFGRSSKPLIKPVGARLFLAPGPVTGPGGRLLLDDGDGGNGIAIEVRGPDNAVVLSESWSAPAAKGTKMRVQGGG